MVNLLTKKKKESVSEVDIRVICRKNTDNSIYAFTSAKTSVNLGKNKKF